MELASLPKDSYLKKQEWMVSQLIGYWAEDKWIPKHNPLLKGELKYPLPWLHFDKINSWAIRIEIKYVCYILATEGKWSFKKLHASSTFISRIAEWLNQINHNLNSLIEKEQELCLVSLRSYLTNKGVYRPGFSKSVVNSSGVLCDYHKDDECIYVLKTIYKNLQDIYDERDEYDKDIWDAKKLKYQNTSSSYCPRFDFTVISQQWLRIAAKKFIKS